MLFDFEVWTVDSVFYEGIHYLMSIHEIGLPSLVDAMDTLDFLEFSADLLLTNYSDSHQAIRTNMSSASSLYFFTTGVPQSLC
jgi:hypothetical protein